MNFEWALQQMREQKYVKRKTWDAPWSKLQQHMWLDHNYKIPVLCFLFGETLKGEDLLAEDWEIHERI